MDNTGHSILDLFNDILIEEHDMKQLIHQNGITSVSTKLPGLIIQSYLLLARLFELDVFEPIGNEVKVEVMETNYDNVNFDEFPINYVSGDQTETDSDYSDSSTDSDYR